MTIAWIALVLSVANTGVNLLTWWRSRHIVKAVLTQAAYGGAEPSDSFTYGIVKVTSRGGACTVETVSLEWADRGCPQPDNFAIRDPFAKETVTDEEMQLMLSTGDFGRRRVLTDGETGGWTRMLTTSDEEAARTFRELRAKVTLGSGEVIYSNKAFIQPQLRPVATTDS